MARQRWLPALLLALALPAGAQERAPTDTVPRTGVVAGEILDQAQRALPLAVITIDGTARQSRSDSAGRFVIERVPAGIQEIVVRRLGYRPVRAQVAVPADSAVVLRITMREEAVQQLPGVVVQEQVMNQLGGIVVDDRLEPVANAVVDLVGLRRSVRTDAAGRFVMVDIDPGNYILEVRAPGYALARRGISMVARIERDVAVRLQPADASTVLTPELAAIVAAEADRRQSLAGGEARFVGADELARWDRAPLITALMGSSGAQALRALMQPGAGRRTRGPTSIGGNSRSDGYLGRGTGAASSGDPLACVLVDGFEITGSDLLSFFRANEVELVEIFPAGSENSRTLCGRFPPSSGCSCPPEPAGVVVWLKK